MSSQGGPKLAGSEPTRSDSKRDRRRGASGRAAVLRRAPSDSDCSGETASLSADSGDRAVRPPPPPPTAAARKRGRRRGSEWEVLEGLKDGQRFDKRPEVFNGYLHKKRKWPLKGWHKRFFVVDGGILVYARSPADVARGRLHGSVDVGLSVISAKARRRRIDIDADEFIYHLRAKTPDVFRTWLNVLKAHRLYRQHLLTFGAREAAPKINAPDDLHATDTSSRESFSSLSEESRLSLCNKKESRSLPEFLSTIQNIYYDELMKIKRDGFNQTAENEFSEDCNKPCQSNNDDEENNHNACHEKRPLVNAQIDCNFVTNQNTYEVDHISKINDDRKEYKNQINIPLHVILTLDQINKYETNKKAKKKTNESKVMFLEQATNPMATCFYFSSKNKLKLSSARLNSALKKSKKSVNLPKYKNYSSEPPAKKLMSKGLLKDDNYQPTVDIKDFFPLTSDVYSEPLCIYCEKTSSEFKRLTDKLMESLYREKISDKRFDDLSVSAVSEIIKDLYNVHPSKETNPIILLFKCLLEYWIQHNSSHQIQQGKSYKSTYQQSDFTMLHYEYNKRHLEPSHTSYRNRRCDFRQYIDSTRRINYILQPYTESRRSNPFDRDPDSFEKDRRIQELEQLLKNTVYACETVASIISKENAEQISKSIIDSIQMNTDKISASTDLSNSTNVKVSSEIQKLEHALRILSQENLPQIALKEILQICLEIISRESFKTQNKNKPTTPESLSPTRCSELGYVKLHEKRKIAGNNSNSPQRKKEKLQEKIHNKILNKSDESKKANSPISPCDKGKSYTKVPRFQTVETPTFHHLDGSGKDDEKDKQIIIDFSKYDLIEIRMNDNPQKTESLSINLKRKEKSYDKYSMANTVPCNPTKFVNDVPLQRNPLKKHTISQKSRLPLQVEKEIQSKVWQSDFSANTFSEIPKKIYNSNKNLQKMDTGSETETINKFEKTTCIQLERQLRDAESNTVRKPTPDKKSGSPLPMVGKYVYKTKYCTEKNEKEQIVEKIYDSTNWNSIAGKSENKTLLTYNCNIPDKDKRSNQSDNSSLQSQPQDSNDSTTRKLNKVSNQQSEDNQSIQPTVKSLNNNETTHTDSDMQQLQETNESDPGILKQLYDEQKDSGDENPPEDNTITLEKLIDEQNNFSADATSLPKTSKPSEIQQKESGDEKPAKSKLTALQKLIAEQNRISTDAPSLPKTRKPSQIPQIDSGDRESDESNKTALQKLLDEQKSANAYASSLPKTRKKIMPQNKQPIVSNTGELQKNVDQQSDTNGLTPSTLKTSTKSYESPKTNQLDPLPENITSHNTTHQQSSEAIGTNTDDFTEPPGENNLTDILRPPNLRKVDNQVGSSITEEQTQLPQSATLHETKETNTDEFKKFIDDNIDSKVPPTSILESSKNTIKSSKTTSHETRETNTDESKQFPEHNTGTKVLAPTVEIKISKTDQMNPITKSVTSHRLSHVSSMTNKDNFKKPLDQKDLIGDLTPSTLTKVEKPVRFSMTNQFDRLPKTKTNEFNTFGTNTDNFEKPLDQNNQKDVLTPSYLTKNENPVGSSVTKELTQLSDTKETNTDEFNKFIDDNISNKVLTPSTLETIEKAVKSSNTNKNETRETKTVKHKYLLEDHMGSNDFITSTLATSENPVKASKTNLMKSAEYSKSKQPTRLSESVRESATDETKDARGDEFKNLLEHSRGTNETLLTLEIRESPEKNSKTHQVDPINNSATSHRLSHDPSGTNTEDFKKAQDLKNTADVFALTKGEKPVRFSMTNEFDDTRASEFNKFLDDNIGINEAAPSSIETNENKRTPSKTSQLTRMSISHSTRMSRSQSHRLSHLLTHRLSRDPTKFNTDDLKKPFDENVNVRSGTNKGNYKKPLDEKSDANKTNVKSSINYQPKRRLTESDTSLKQRPSRKSNVGDLRNLSTFQSNMSVFTPSSPETHMNKVSTLKNKPLNVLERQAPQPSASYTRELLKLLEEQSALSITSESGKPSDKPVESASGNPSKKLRVSVPQAPYRRPSNTNVLQQLLDQNGNETGNNSAPEQPLHLAKKRWRKKKNTPPPNNTDQPPNTEPSNTKKFKKIINSAVVTPIKQVKSSMDSRHKKAKNSSSSRLVPETSPSETNKNQQNTADNPIFLSINSAKSEPKIRSLNSNAQGNYYQKIDPDDIDEKFVMMLLEDVAHISKNMPKLNKDIKSLVQKLKKKSNKHMKCFCPPGLHLLGNIYKGNNVVYTPASFAIGTQYTEDNIQPTNKTNDSIKITVSKGVSNTAAASENTVGASGESNVNELSNVNPTDIKSAILSQGFTEIVSIDSEIQTKQVVRNESTITEELTYKSVSNDAETNTQQPRSHTVNRLIEYFLETNSQGMRILRPRIQCVHGLNTNLLSSMRQDLSTTPQQEVHKGVKPIPMSLKSSMATGMDDSNKEKLFYYNKTYDTLQLITIPNFEPIRIISRTKCTVKCSVKNINNRTVLVFQEENGTTGLLSPSQPTLKGPQAGFVSGTPGGRLAGWSIESGTGLEAASRELGQAQLSVQQLRRLLHALEHPHPDTDQVSLEGASPNVKKDRRKFGLRKKKSSSKCASVELAPPHLDGSASHMALSALTAPPSPGGGASSVPNSAASLPIEYILESINLE